MNEFVLVPQAPARGVAWALLLVVTVLGCGPKGAGEDAGDASASSSTTAASTTDATSQATTEATTTGDPACPPDADLCVEVCKGLVADDPVCGRSDYTCFDWCLNRLKYSDLEGCGAEERGVLRCERDAADLAGCEAQSCAATYVPRDICRGYCSHLGGVPFSGASTDECEWGSDCQGGHTLEMRCPATASPECSCWIDDAEVGTCVLSVDLKPFDCNQADPQFHVLSGCCLPYFNEVLMPEPVDDTCPNGGGKAPPASTGQPCALEGMYTECAGGGGTIYCDAFAGGLLYGPCVAEPECELAGPLYCEKFCDLVDGVPTWVMTPCDGSTSG